MIYRTVEKLGGYDSVSASCFDRGPWAQKREIWCRFLSGETPQVRRGCDAVVSNHVQVCEYRSAETASRLRADKASASIFLPPEEDLSH